jgi:hypothetical protein
MLFKALLGEVMDQLQPRGLRVKEMVYKVLGIRKPQVVSHTDLHDQINIF